MVNVPRNPAVLDKEVFGVRNEDDDEEVEEEEKGRKEGRRDETVFVFQLGNLPRQRLIIFQLVFRDLTTNHYRDDQIIILL